MKETDLASMVIEIVLNFNEKQPQTAPHAHLSIPSNLRKFLWHDSSLEKLVRRFLMLVFSLNKRARRIEIAVHGKAKMTDLERFLAIAPLHWIQVSASTQGSIEIGDPIRGILQDLGYQCDEWLGLENSEIQLGTYCRDKVPEARLILCLHNSRANQKIEILVPITQSSSATINKTMTSPIP
jgi:hypothetical protein